MLKTVTKTDKAAFNGMTRKKPKSFTLIYKQGKKEENIPGYIEIVRYALCQWKRNELENEPQYKSGQLIIKSNY